MWDEISLRLFYKEQNSVESLGKNFQIPTPAFFYPRLNVGFSTSLYVKKIIIITFIGK